MPRSSLVCVSLWVVALGVAGAGCGASPPEVTHASADDDPTAATDRCPGEDLDGWQDDDGCLDPDNDDDGYADVNDRCPNDPETYNGDEDEDGCPDRPTCTVEVDDAPPGEPSE